jgi:hypothetical protein
MDESIAFPGALDDFSSQELFELTRFIAAIPSPPGEGLSECAAQYSPHRGAIHSGRIHSSTKESRVKTMVPKVFGDTIYGLGLIEDLITTPARHNCLSTAFADYLHLQPPIETEKVILRTD